MVTLLPQAKGRTKDRYGCASVCLCWCVSDQSNKITLNYIQDKWLVLLHCTVSEPPCFLRKIYIVSVQHPYLVYRIYLFLSLEHLVLVLFVDLFQWISILFPGFFSDSDLSQECQKSYVLVRIHTEQGFLRLALHCV